MTQSADYVLVADGRVLGALTAAEMRLVASYLRAAGCPTVAAAFDIDAQIDGSGAGDDGRPTP